MNSKLLLFGEYLVLQNATALALPLANYQMNWTQQNDNKELKKILLDYLDYVSAHEVLLAEISIEKFREDIEQGIGLVSNIPIGFGLGSSGAFVANVFDRYGKDKHKSDEQLLKLFSLMESKFHGSSSGFDPLVSYKNKALIRQNEVIKSVEIDLNHTNIHYALMNSGKARNTEKLVSQFKDLLKNDSYLKEIQLLKELNEMLIENFIAKNETTFFHFMQQFSILQLKLFKDFITEEVESYWRKGLEKEHYFMKLCGAGGGGFFLAFSNTSNNFESNWIKIK